MSRDDFLLALAVMTVLVGGAVFRMALTILERLNEVCS